MQAERLKYFTPGAPVALASIAPLIGFAHSLVLRWLSGGAQAARVAVLGQHSHRIVEKILISPAGSLGEYEDQLPCLVTRFFVSHDTSRGSDQRTPPAKLLVAIIQLNGSMEKLSSENSGCSYSTCVVSVSF